MPSAFSHRQKFDGRPARRLLSPYPRLPCTQFHQYDLSWFLQMYRHQPWRMSAQVLSTLANPYLLVDSLPSRGTFLWHLLEGRDVELRVNAAVEAIGCSVAHPPC